MIFESVGVNLLGPTRVIFAAQSHTKSANETAPKASPTSAPTLLNRYREMLMKGHVAKLGELNPWQLRILEEEIAADIERYVQGGRQTQEGLKADFDWDAITKALKYYSEKKQTVFTVLRAENSCSVCAQAVQSVKPQVITALDRRGLGAVFLNPEDIGLAKMSAKLTENQVENLVDQKLKDVIVQKPNAAGTLLINFRMQPLDGIDDAHAEDRGYQVVGTLRVKDFVETFSFDVTVGDRFEGYVLRAVIDSFSGVGSKLLGGGGVAVTSVLPQATRDDSSVLIEVREVFSHRDLNAVKENLAKILAPDSLLLEKAQRRGVTWLKVIPKQSVSDLVAKLEALKSGSLSLISKQEEGVVLEWAQARERK